MHELDPLVAAWCGRHLGSPAVEVFFAEFHPWVALCAFPDCTHTHEDRCAVLRAVRRRLIAMSRYVSYLGLFRK